MYKLGMIGTGDITSSLIEAAGFEERILPYAIYSRNMKTAESFKQKHNLELAYDDMSEMLENDDIDIIYVASPNGLHYKQSLEAIKAGKHVLIEKPMSLLPEEIDDLYTLAKKHNVFIMEAYVSITYNTFNKVKEWIDTLGEIGKVDFHYAKQTRHFEAYMSGQNFNVFDGKMGGGALRDLGPYTIYPLVSWFGVPMQSHYFSTKNELDADESTLALCHYETFSATIQVSKLFADNRPNIISGDNGYIEIDQINMLSHIKLFDAKGNLVEELKTDYEHRMAPQLVHMADVLDSKQITSDIYTKQLAMAVSSIISGNYK